MALDILLLRLLARYGLGVIRLTPNTLVPCSDRILAHLHLPLPVLVVIVVGGLSAIILMPEQVLGFSRILLSP
jgi:hypothetical protein